MSWGTTRLTVRYGQTLALAAVSLDVPAGQVTSVVGGDGAGKSTLLRAIAGAQAGEGEIRRPEARRIGYLPAGSGTYPDLSAEENLAFAAAVYGLPAAEARTRAGELLERTGLVDARHRLAGRLSGGMRQKLGVVRALLHRPALLVLDEPTTGIDPVSRAELWQLIAGAAADGAAVVLATTYLDEAERATSVLVLDAGRPLAVGPPDSITAAVPGSITSLPARPAGEPARRAWRRGRTWRLWSPEGNAAPGDPRAEPVVPDLHDAVTVAALRRELADRDLADRELAGALPDGEAAP